MHQTQKSRFLRLTALTMIIYVVLAFGAATWMQPFRLERYVKPLVVVHIIASLGWLAIFFGQSGLVLRGEIEKHRQRLPIASGLVLVIAVTSVIITFQWGSAQRVVVETRDVVAFAVLFALAVFAAKQARYENHKRLMLIAGLNLIHPAHVRVPNIFDWPFYMSLPITLFSWIAIPLAYDWLTQRKVHKATWFGIAFTLLSFVLVIAIAFSPLMPLIETVLYGESGDSRPLG